MPVTIRLGNTAPVEAIRQKDDSIKRVSRDDLGNQVTTISLPEEPPMRAAEALRLVREIWPWHSDADGPEWIEVDDDDEGRGSRLAELLVDEFTADDHEVVIGKPDEWEEDAE